MATDKETKTDNDKEITYPAWHNAVAGGVAGAGSRMFTAPLDLIRIRRQLTPPTQYPSESMLESWRKIVQTEGGVTALFRGNMAAVCLWVGYAAVQFSLYNKTRQAIEELDPNKSYPTTTAFVAGAVAGTCATLATYPFDVCRTTFAARGIEQATPRQVPLSSLMEPYYSSSTSAAAANAPPKTITEFVVQLYRQKGIAGFYAGAGPAVVQIIPYMGLNFAIYDRLTRKDRRVGLSAYAGAISGFVSKIIVYPLDTTKRRLQVQAFYGSDSELLFQRYKGMRDCAWQIATTEGIGGFYRGVVPSVLKTTISTGLSFAFFRFSKNVLEVLHNSER